MTIIDTPVRTAGFVLEPISWEFYDRTLREFQQRHIHVRVTYDNGRMEFKTLGDRHERTKKLIARLLELYALEMDIPITGMGSVTLRRRRLRKGVESDECYYVRTPVPPITDGGLNLNRYPPPDLAVEVNITHGSIEREPIYAQLGVAEVWRLERAHLVPLLRQPDGSYQPMEASVAFPDLSMTEFSRFVQMGLERTQHEAARAFRDWLRASGQNPHEG